MISPSARSSRTIMLLLTCLFSAPDLALAQQGLRYGPPPTIAPGLLQPAYMLQTKSIVQPAAAYHQQQVYRSPSQIYSGSPQEASTQFGYYSTPPAASPAPNYYTDAERMGNSRNPRGGDVMATNQHTLFQYRRMYRRGTTPQPQELVGKWNGVNKGIVEIAGYGQFVKDIQVVGNGQIYGDNIQVDQVEPGLVRNNAWQPKFDYQTSDYERRGRFHVQPANGRGIFGHGTTLSYADGGNPQGDPARVLLDQVVRIDGNHMLGRAVAKFGPFQIPLAYFVLERK